MRYKIRIELLNVTNPIVWREMLVPRDLTFHDLHKMIQCGMGWRNSHLYSFSENDQNKYFIIESPHGEDVAIDASTTQAGSILLSYLNQFSMNYKAVNKIKYIYDYGDYWEHTIEVIDLDRNTTASPEIAAGEGACPPENCGGSHGYEDLKMNIRTGKPSEIHGDHYQPWLKKIGYKNFDPDVYDIEGARKKLVKWRSLE